MKFLVLSLYLFAAVFSYGQGKLKMEITKAGDTLYSTGDKKIYSSPGAKNSIAEVLKSTLYQSGGGFMLCLQIETGRTSVFTISSDEPVEISFTDGSMLALYSGTNSNSRRSNLNYGCYAFVFYTVSSQALSRLQSADIKTLVVNSSAGKITYELKEKNADVIRTQAAAFN